MQMSACLSMNACVLSHLQPGLYEMRSATALRHVLRSLACHVQVDRFCQSCLLRHCLCTAQPSPRALFPFSYYHISMIRPPHRTLEYNEKKKKKTPKGKKKKENIYCGEPEQHCCRGNAYIFHVCNTRVFSVVEDVNEFADECLTPQKRLECEHKRSERVHCHQIKYAEEQHGCKTIGTSFIKLSY